MRHNSIRLSLILGLSLPVLLAACGESTSLSSEEFPTVNLPVAAATRAAALEGALASGTVEADDRAQLVAQASGTLRAPGLFEGQSVRRGQVLATIDQRHADADVGRARAALDAALAEQHDAGQDVARDAALAQSGALSGDTFRKEQLRHDIATAGVSQARAVLAAAETSRSYTSIVSPIDGVVITRYVHDGDTVMPGAQLVTVEGRRGLLFRFAAPQGSISAFATGSTVPVLIDGHETQPIIGRVRGVVPSADPATRRYTVEVVLPANSGILPGMFGRVRLPAPANANTNVEVVTVPASAVTDRGGLTGVFVVDGDRRLGFRWVRLGDRIGDRIVVTSGLSAGEQIVTEVGPTIRDGARLAQSSAR